MGKDTEICLDLMANVNEGEMSSIMASDLGKIVNQYTRLGELDFVFSLIERGITAGDLVILKDGRVAFKDDIVS